MDITDHPHLAPGGLSAKAMNTTLRGYPDNPTHQAIVLPLLSSISTDQLMEYNNKLSAYNTRYYGSETGKQAAQWIKSEFEKEAGGSVSVDFFPHSWLQPSVIARIHGTGDFAQELVIIGAHEDSINGASGRAPGADDDASGVSCVLEAFRILVEAGFQPDRTIEFQTYSAEEVGLRGSLDIASKYQEDGKQVYSMMQLDMTMYDAGSATPHIGIMTDNTNADLTTFLRKLVETYSTLPWKDTQCGYGCSDHASWNRAGYPACMPFESQMNFINRAIHTPNDVLSKLDLEHGAEFVKVALGYLVELSLVD